MDPRLFSSAQTQQREHGVGLDKLGQNGAGNAQECVERVFIFAHPQEGLRSRIQRLRVAGVYRERDVGVLDGLLEKPQMNVTRASRLWA